MGETARERFRRSQAESATGTGKESGGLGSQAESGGTAEAGGRTVADIKARLLQKRRVELGRRLHALGVPTAQSELPESEADIADLEHFCDEQERAAR